jgi:hypothetical protein
MSSQTNTVSGQGEAAGARPRSDDAFEDDSVLIDFFERLAVALSTGDASTVAASWEAPALVVGHEGVIAVSSVDEVEAFFRGASEQYRSRGICATRAEIVRVQWVGLRTAIAEVRWPMLDEHNRELGDERSTYTLRTNDDGELKIRVTVAHTEPSH